MQKQKDINYVSLSALIFLLALFVFFALFNSLSFSAEIDLTKAVIHHTASNDVSAAEIDKWHKQRGWNGIGYHFVIRKNGKIEEGRSIQKIGAHAKGRNHYIGIALTGYDTFTNEQIISLTKLLEQLEIKHIETHHEKCPGKGLCLEKIRYLVSNIP